MNFDQNFQLNLLNDTLAAVLAMLKIWLTLFKLELANMTAVSSPHIG